MAKTAAVMGGNTVTNVIMVDDTEQSAIDLGAELIEYTAENPAGIGWIYNRESGTFSAPEILAEE